MSSQGPIPILIGVMGHRDLRPEDRPQLEAAVRDLLQSFRSDCPHTPFVLFSSLAEGADQLVARIALELGFRLHVPLPVPKEFNDQFTDPEAAADFETLLAKAEHVFVVGDANADRDDQFRITGEFIAQHSQILIALWDGKTSDKVGGTAEVVRWRLEVLPLETVSHLHQPDTVRSGPVYQIVTPRRSESPPANPFTLVSRLPAGFHSETEARASYRQSMKAIDRLNTHAANASELSPEDAARSRNYLLPDAEADALPEGFRVTRQAFAVADALATRYQRATMRTLGTICLLVLLAVVGYEVTGHLMHVQQLGLLLYPIILAIAFVIFLRAKRFDFQNHYHDYRALAEGLRVQFFWRLAGLTHPVEEFYLRRQRRELNWVRTALRILWSLQGGELPGPQLTSDEERRRLRLAITHWVEDQNAFFARRTPEEKQTAHLCHVAIRIFLAIGLTLSIVIGIVLLSPGLFGDGLKQWMDAHPIANGILLLSTSLPMVFAAMIHTYRKSIALGSHVKQYEVMQLLFTKARERLKSLGESPEPQVIRTLIEELGKEALVENGDWVLLYRDRPMELPMGR